MALTVDKLKQYNFVEYLENNLEKYSNSVNFIKLCKTLNEYKKYADKRANKIDVDTGSHSWKIYGGAVRDVIANVEPSDYDIQLAMDIQQPELIDFLKMKKFNIEYPDQSCYYSDFCNKFAKQKPDNFYKMNTDKRFVTTIVIQKDGVFDKPIRLDIVAMHVIPTIIDFTVNSLQVSQAGSISIIRNYFESSDYEKYYKESDNEYIDNMNTIFSCIHEKKLCWIGKPVCDYVETIHLYASTDDERYHYLSDQFVQWVPGSLYTINFYYTSGKFIERLSKMISKGYTWNNSRNPTIVVKNTNGVCMNYLFSELLEKYKQIACIKLNVDYIDKLYWMSYYDVFDDDKLYFQICPQMSQSIVLGDVVTE